MPIACIRSGLEGSRSTVNASVGTVLPLRRNDGVGQSQIGNQACLFEITATCAEIAGYGHRRCSETDFSRAEPQSTTVHNIAIASIKVGKRMRPLGDISSLVESIREIGLLNPILVTRDRRLISGLHRLKAFIALGRKHIPAIILSVSPAEAQSAKLTRTWPVTT